MRSVRALQGMEMQELQAQVRETMIQQEMMFQEQVRELHRLYEKQKLLMHELKNKNYSTRRIKEEASSSSWELGEGGHTRDLLHCLNRQDLRDRRDKSFSAVKRRKMLDLEQLPDDNDEATEYVHSINENAALDFGDDHQWRASQSQTLSLFPIPSNTASASTISNLEIERSWDQQQFSQFGRLSDQISTISHQTLRDPWNPLGQDGARLIGEIVRDYQQDGKMDNYSFGGMVADSFAASSSRNHLVQPATWKRQMPSLSYSYHQPSNSKFCFEGNRIYTDSLRNSWCLSGNLTLPPDKPPVSVLVKAEESAPSPKLKPFTRSNAAGGESEKVGRILNLDDEPKCRTVSHVDSDLMMKSGAEDDGTVVNRLLLGGTSCTDRNMNVMAMARGGEDHRVSARVDLNEDCASDHEAVMQDSISNDTITWAATILLSLAPENYKCSSKARLETSSLLSSDVKLFKSVVIMLKQSGAKSSSKKLVVKSFHGKGGGGGKDSAAATTLLETLKKTGIGNSEGDEEDEADKKAGDDDQQNGKQKKKENKRFSAWMWGDVTRRKRMQRHRNSNLPQQVQVRCLN